MLIIKFWNFKSQNYFKFWNDIETNLAFLIIVTQLSVLTKSVAKNR
jgi:hypothetical protein